MKNKLDVAFARSLFPFEQTDLKNWALFDNAGGTLACNAVIERLTHYYTHNKVQPYGDNAPAAAAGEQMDAGRRVMAELLGVGPETLTIGPSTTQNLNTLSLACAGFLKPGDEIVVSEQDHEANIGGWERAAGLTGALLRFWEVDTESAELELSGLEAVLSDRTRVVCVTHSSNIVGTVNPMDEIVRLGHDAGARVVIDGVSYAPHRWPDFATSGVDAYAFSTYKTYGTHLGILYTDPGFAEALAPQCHFFNQGKPQSLLDSAGPDHAAIAGLAGLGSFFEAMYEHHFGSTDKPVREKALAVSGLMHEHESELCAVLLEALRSMPVRVVGRSEMAGREANVAVLPDEVPAGALESHLAARGVATKHGHFYAMRLFEVFGLDPIDGVLRVSFAHYNTMDETERLVAGLRSFFTA